MSVTSERRAADNRASRHQQLITCQPSPRMALRRAVEWVMSEARHIDQPDIRALTEQISGIARDLNERSRP